MNYRRLKLKDICHIIKGETGITKAIPGDFPMITLSEERKSHNEYQFDTKAVIIPLVSSTGHGHASIKRIHYQEGKFALGSILCALVPKRDDEYDPMYLYYILDSDKENIFVPLMKGMANVSLPINRIKEIEVDLPSLDNQKKLAKIFSFVSNFNNDLFTKAIFQKESIKQLRQSILQLAVQGRLTANWRKQNPDVEPASKLLNRIQTEKEEMIKAGKIKRQKALPKIGEDEKPFALPEGWEWCRLGEIIQISSGDGLTSKQMDKSGKIPVYGGNGVTGYHSSNNIDKQTIVIGRVGAYCGSVHLTEEKAWITDNAFITKHSDFIFKNWIVTELICLNLGSHARRSAQPVISGQRVYPIIFGLPPLPEQKAIVERVSQLMTWCDELEKRIEERDTLHEKIMQAVVKQAGS